MIHDAFSIGASSVHGETLEMRDCMGSYSLSYLDGRCTSTGASDLPLLINEHTGDEDRGVQHVRGIAFHPSVRDVLCDSANVTVAPSRSK